MKINKIEVGDVYPTTEGGSVTVIAYRGALNVVVKHNDKYGHVSVVQADCLRKGRLKNPYHPSVFGVGYIGAGRYASISDGERSPAYSVWKGMLSRCYYEKRREMQPSYIGCSVADEWLNFQTFADWFYKQRREDGWQLDKDIIVRGNKIYSPNTTSFVPQEINKLLNTKRRFRGDLPIGVSRHGHRFQASVRLEGKLNALGLYDTPEEAFSVYKEVKEAHIKKMANFFKEELDPRVYEALIVYEVREDD